MSRASAIRSWLFVPGDSAAKQEKAAAGPADALILDLEDSVAPQRLAEARACVHDFLASRRARSGQQLWVRVNSLASGKLADDLAATMPGAPDGYMLPKVTGARETLQVAELLGPLEAEHGHPLGATQLLVIATETAQSLVSLSDYATMANARLAGLTWGAEDLSCALGAAAYAEDGSLTFTFELARSLCLLGAGAAGLPAFDGVCVDFRNHEALVGQAARACRDGFAGKLAIHPAQVAPINAAFSPQPQEVARARAVVAAFAAAPEAGVLSLDGQMLDRPHLLKAQRILERAARVRGAP